MIKMNYQSSVEPMSEEALPSPSSGRCIYGYAFFISSNCLLLLYLISIVPDHVLSQLGLTYLPSKYWYIAIPTIISIIIVSFGFIIYPSIVMILTDPMDSVNLFRDNYSYSKKDNRERHGDEMISNEIPPIYDITVEEVTKLLYYCPDLLRHKSDD